MFRLLDIIIHLTFVCLAKADGPAFDLAPVFKSRFNVDNLSYVKSDNRFGTHPRGPSANPIHDPNLTLRIPANPHLDCVKNVLQRIVSTLVIPLGLRMINAPHQAFDGTRNMCVKT